MKFLLFLLSALAVASAADIPHLKKRPGDIVKLIDRARITEEIETTTKSISRSHESEECMTVEENIYNNTAISSAAITNFMFSYLWTDPNFDMEGFFSSMNFDSECSNLGGVVKSYDIKFGCTSLGVDTYLEGYKFCMPDICNDWEYTITQTFIVAILGEFSGCESAELVTDEVPSMECISSLTQFYNETDLADFSPENFMFSGGAEYVEGTGKCKSYSKTSDVVVCDMPNFREEMSNITAMCGDLGGEVYPLDMVMSVPGYHRTYRRYPFCKPSMCSDSDIASYYGYISTMGEHYYEDTENPMEMDFKKATMNSCDETANNKASMKQVKGKVLARSCKWLKNRPADMKKKFCKKKEGFGDLSPAGKVCPSTCCVCKEKSENVFLKKTQLDKDSLLKTTTADCEWLKGVTESNRSYHCSKLSASYIGGYPPAYIACPETCGTCSKEM